MLAVVPSIIAMILFSKALTLDGQRFVRWLGLQTAAMTLILVNVLLALGYTVGWVLTKGYIWLFDDFGTYPYPDRFYLFRDVSPLDLPFAIQLEALGVAMVGLFALSWVVYIVQARAWKEGTFVGCLTGAAAGAPYVDFNVIDEMSQYLPSLGGAPPWFLAACIPALKGLFTRDLQGLIVKKDIPAENVTCKGCGCSLELDLGRFCPKCGHVFKLVAED